MAVLDIAVHRLHVSCAHTRQAGLGVGRVLEADCPRSLAFGKALHTTLDFGVYGGLCTL